MQCHFCFILLHFFCGRLPTSEGDVLFREKTVVHYCISRRFSRSTKAVISTRRTGSCVSTAREDEISKVRDQKFEVENGIAKTGRSLLFRDRFRVLKTPFLSRNLRLF